MVVYALIVLALSFSTVFTEKSKTCGPYPYVTLEHGNVSRTGFMKYTFRCDKGYTLLLRKPTVRCHRGNWIPSEKPKCYKKEGQCDDPPIVAHSKTYGENRNVDATVKYICDDGYILLGNSEITCTRSGHWKGILPTCMAESEPIKNVAERLSDGFVTTVANYSADTPEGRTLDAKSLLLGLELYIIIDRSSSVDPVQLEEAKRFVKFLLQRFAVKNGPDNERGTRASVITFGTEVQRVFKVGNKSISNPTLAGIAVDSIQPNGGGTNLEGALTLLILDADDGSLRPEAKRAIFLMTDGEPNIANPAITPQDIARQLKNDYDFEIFAVGIGKDVNVHLLNDLASQPPLSHVFMLEDYSNLNDIMPILRKTKEKPCSPYPHVAVEHGFIRRLDNQKFLFKCDSGYFLASSKTVRCFRGNWTSLNEPKCLRIQGQCNDPPVVDNAGMYGEDRAVGSSVKYICKEGFVLLGHSELDCSKGGYWNNRPPTCMDLSEPLSNVADRLKNSFVTQMESYSNSTPEGRLLDRSSLLLGLELFLLIDRSSSVDPVHLETAKNFIKFLLRRFNIRNGNDNKNGTRAAVLAFGSNLQIVFDIDNENISNPSIASNAIDNIEPHGGGTNLESAFTQVLVDVIKLRPNAKRALFLMTDGDPNIGSPGITPQDLARELKNTHDFEIFTVGIGKDINSRLLGELASEPPLSHVFILDNYPSLEEIMKVIENRKPPAQPISKDQCGYNGTDDQPWLATLYIGKNLFKVCGGALICSQWVLTAGSCLYEGKTPVNTSDVFIVLGERNLLKEDDSQTNFYALEISFHPHFKLSSTVKYNLALIKLNIPTSRYKPACLPPTDRHIPLHLNLKINASTAGWGKITASNITMAHAGDLNFERNSTNLALSEERECPIRKTGITKLCAGRGTRSCYGMIGSPLMAEDSTTHFQHVLGIEVDRTHCVQGQNQYIELTKYLGWINQQTANCHIKHWGLGLQK